MIDADETPHPAVQRAAEVLGELPGYDIDDHAAVLEQVYAHLQSALSGAERPAPIEVTQPAPTEPATHAGVDGEAAT